MNKFTNLNFLQMISFFEIYINMFSLYTLLPYKYLPYYQLVPVILENKYS